MMRTNLTYAVIMHLTYRMDRPIDPERHYLSPGGYSLEFADGTVIPFDFEDSAGVVKNDRAIFVMKGLDISCFRSAKMLPDYLMHSQIAAVREAFIYTGEAHEDPEIHPVAVEQMSFTLIGSDGEIAARIQVPEAILARAVVTDGHEVEKRFVYICSPYAGDVESNIKAAKRYSRYAALNGCVPITPHLLFTQYLDDSIPEERQLGLNFGYTLLDKCSEIWVFGDRISAGMKAEIARAKEKNYRLRYFSADCREYANAG